MKFLDGYKTYVAGFGFIAVAVGGFALGLTGNDSSAAMDFEQAVETALQGLALIGIGGKLQKIIRR